MKEFNITGMSCASCSARVEKAVSSLKGVKNCSVNLLTNSMKVEADCTDDEIISAVINAGYGASLKGAESVKSDKSSDKSDSGTETIFKRLVSSVILLIVLMYFSMGHMFHLPLPEFLRHNSMSLGLIQLLFTSVILIINKKFFVSGIKSVINKSPNMDTLVSLGSGVSYVYSVVILFLMSDKLVGGDTDGAMTLLHGLYFESSAMIVTLITVGKTLESYSKGKTTNALKELMDLSPDYAVIIEDGKEVRINADQLKVGDVFVVKPGDKIPADGVIVDGTSSVNESALTGESIPVDKVTGDYVKAATINKDGYLKCKAEKVGVETSFSKIISLVEDASSSKAPIAKIADKVSGVFVPTVLVIALITFIVWILVSKDISLSLARAISVLVISCPCALGLATPVAIMVGSGVGAKNGLLFKNGTALEYTGKANIVVLDKTGTVTKGMPVVSKIIPSKGYTEQELLKYAYTLEIRSEHPLANAIKEKCEALNVAALETEEFSAVPGKGVCGRAEGKFIAGGNYKYVSELTENTDDLNKIWDSIKNSGTTPMFFVTERELLGVITVEDEIKPDSKEAIRRLESMGLEVYMLTGDNEDTARLIGEKCGIKNIIAGVLPDEKEKYVRNLMKKGRVIMVGDGINDAPALAAAHIGMAIGAGADVAIESADVVLVRNSVTDVASAVSLSRSVIRNIYENLFWAFIYNTLGIPLAAGVFYKFGVKLDPMFGAAAMSLSSFCVVMNALRLNTFKANKERRKNMSITVKIEGMMCGHCESRVKEALEALEEVDSAEVSHKKGTAVLTLNSEVDSEKVKDAIEKQGYKYLG